MRRETSIHEKYSPALGVLVALICLCGAASIALLSAGAHLDGTGRLTTGGQFLLPHCVGALSLVALRRGGGLWFICAAMLLLGGAGLFAGDLAWRVWQGQSLFANAAPAGGVAAMLGWVVAAIGALTAISPQRTKNQG
jgi:uncharacterized membrane protein YgdD (TMEM256/DUF423 family)